MDLAYFRPGRTFGAETLEGYNANVLGVARQFHFSHRDPSRSVDFVLFVNGLPVATIELKNPNTGQEAGYAIAQYRQRDPDDLFFARRTLVHFAVDPNHAFITTRLEGKGTQFLPFNVGSAGAGNAGGAGNPESVRVNYRFLTYGRTSGRGITGWRSCTVTCTSRPQGRRTIRIPRRVSFRAITSGTPCSGWSPMRSSTGRGGTT